MSLSGHCKTPQHSTFHMIPRESAMSPLLNFLKFHKFTRCEKCLAPHYELQPEFPASKKCSRYTSHTIAKNKPNKSCLVPPLLDNQEVSSTEH